MGGRGKGRKKQRTVEAIQAAMQVNASVNATPSGPEDKQARERRRNRRRATQSRLTKALAELTMADGCVETAPTAARESAAPTATVVGEDVRGVAIAPTAAIGSDSESVATDMMQVEEPDTGVMTVTNVDDFGPGRGVCNRRPTNRKRRTIEEIDEALRVNECVNATPADDEDRLARERRRGRRHTNESRLRKARRVLQMDDEFQENEFQENVQRRAIVANASSLRDCGVEEGKQEENHPDVIAELMRSTRANESIGLHSNNEDGNQEDSHVDIARDQHSTSHDGSSVGHGPRPPANESEAQGGMNSRARRVWDSRRKKQYRRALANHEVFDVSKIRGTGVVNGRHKLGAPTQVCSHCRAWKWTNESDVVCCIGGKVALPPLQPAPTVLRELYRDEEFRRQVRVYNQVFALTSVGASFSGGQFEPVAEDTSVQGQRGVYTYKIQGAMGHFMGSLLPSVNAITGEPTNPKFAQIYVYDPDMEARVARRQGIFSGLDPVAMLDLESMLQEFNPFAREFVSMGERIRQMIQEGHNPVDVVFRLRANNREGPRTHNLPTTSEVAAILVDDGSAAKTRDLLLFPRQGGLLRLFETLNIYDPTQYPLLFPHGELGWTYTDSYTDGATYRDKGEMALREFVAYRLYQKDGDQSVLHQGGRLFQQYVVDQRAKIEQETLRWVASHQKELRAELYRGVLDAYINENVTEDHRDEGPVYQYDHNNQGTVYEYDQESDTLVHPDRPRRKHFLQEIGKRIVLPASFTGGERYMYEQYQDSIAIVREYGKPDLFMTVTCNPTWDEITSAIEDHGGPHLTAQDRPDIVARVWHQKLKAVLKDLDEGVFGVQVARIYVVEFQKRGLPHAHILIILADEDKPKTRHDFDQFVSAEVPDATTHPSLYKTVMTNMLHGPCGVQHPNSPCMDGNKCSKSYPKPLSEVTEMNQDSYPVYRRRRRPDGVLKFNGREYDNATINQWVVPYNPFFSHKYDCHINVEVCSTITAVKYLYKYVYKGSDRTEISAQVFRDDAHESTRPQREQNEIIRYVKGRYISPVEACQRLFEYPIQGKTHAVVKLPIHIPGGQTVTYCDRDDPERVLRNGAHTKLTRFFELAATDEEASGMLYQDIPKVFRWDKKERRWVRYKKSCRTIGRMIHCSPHDQSRFYLRMLLCHRRGPTSYEDIRTVDGHVCSTYQEAARRLGLLDSDQEWWDCLEEASSYQMPYQLRQLFATILLYSFPSNVAAMFDRFYVQLSQDFEFTHRGEEDKDIIVKFKTLTSLNDLLVAGGKNLADYEDMPQLSQFPEQVRVACLLNPLIRRELGDYNKDELRRIVGNVDRLNSNQREIYDELITAVENVGQHQRLFFIDGPGGTGKSTLLNHVLAKVRLEGKIAIAVASSGIASLLLPGGRTAHSTFKIPIKLTTTSTCSISKQSNLKALIEEASLIVWDEAPMTHRHAFEALDRTLRDILGREYEPFGGKVVVLSGDFRQILPVVLRGTPSDIVMACLKSSALWPLFKQLRLTVNMRVQCAANQETADELSSFSEFLLAVGEGRHEVCDELGSDYIKLSQDLILQLEEQEIGDDDVPVSVGLTRIVDAMYASADLNDSNVATDTYFAERTILTPTNAAVQRVNEMVASRLHKNPQVYLSADSIQDDRGGAVAAFFEQEVLHSLNLNGIPPHKLILKEGIPVMLMRNLNPDAGLCNGTRLRVLKLTPNVIRASIMTGAHSGEEVLIPRIVFISENDSRDFPFHLRRKQFPIVPAFAMTINKAQGQTVQNMGLYLPSPCFSHGQLYVALSRVTSRTRLKIVVERPIAVDDDGTYTSNIVYREIFE